jgi:hypothetical protein
MTNCLMPKLVGTQSTQLTVRALTQITGAVAFQPQAGKLYYSLLQKIVSLIFCLDPQHFLLIL